VLRALRRRPPWETFLGFFGALKKGRPTPKNSPRPDFAGFDLRDLSPFCYDITRDSSYPLPFARRGLSGRSSMSTSRRIYPGGLYPPARCRTFSAGLLLAFHPTMNCRARAAESPARGPNPGFHRAPEPNAFNRHRQSREQFLWPRRPQSPSRPSADREPRHPRPTGVLTGEWSGRTDCPRNNLPVATFHAEGKLFCRAHPDSARRPCRGVPKWINERVRRGPTIRESWPVVPDAVTASRRSGRVALDRTMEPRSADAVRHAMTGRALATCV
jgi:hypothetical protein